MTNEVWRELKIGDLILSADSGMSLLGEDRIAEQGDAAILTLSSVSQGLFRPDHYKVASGPDKDRLSLSPKRDRILISRSNTPDLVGAAVYVDRDYPNRFLPDLIWQLEPNPEQEFSMRWLCYWLQSDNGRSAIKRVASGSSKSMVKISKAVFSKIPVTVPSLPEQHRIADILATWDRAIGLTEQLIIAKQQYKRGLAQQLLTGRRRFKHFICSEETQDTEIGPIASDWHYVSIGSIAQHVSERNTAGLDLPVLSCTKHEGLVDSLSYFGRQIFSDDTSTYKVVHSNQFAYATNHIEEGSIGYQDIHDKALISPMYTVFETAPTVDDRFLYALLKTETYRQIFERNTSASVDRRGSLRWNEFSRIKVPLPSIQEQQAIAEVLETCSRELMLLDRKLALLKKQKQGLMQQLLTGKIRVKI